jgi:hypothetical protein
MENYDDLPWDDADKLPTAADSLHSLVRELTAKILEADWFAAVHGQIDCGIWRARVQCGRAEEALGPAADAAVEAGLQDFAAGFTSSEARRIWLSGTDLERQILVEECKLKYLRKLADEDGAADGNPLSQ